MPRSYRPPVPAQRKTETASSAPAGSPVGPPAAAGSPSRGQHSGAGAHPKASRRRGTGGRSSAHLTWCRSPVQLLGMPSLELPSWMQRHRRDGPARSSRGILSDWRSCMFASRANIKSSTTRSPLKSRAASATSRRLGAGQHRGSLSSITIRPCRRHPLWLAPVFSGS